MSAGIGRIARRFEELRAAGRRALIPYITGGHPRPQWTVPLMHELVRGGADLIELGVPFSDPMADGPVIQRACEDALRQGMTLHSVLEAAGQFRAQDAATPVVLMGYLNPVHAMGVEPFADAAAAAGVDGVLLVDLPPEEGTELSRALSANGLSQIRLVSPTTSDARLRRIADGASGFLYYVALTGVTGADHFDPQTVGDAVRRIRAASNLPVGVGFGIRDRESAAAAAREADAVVVGSALVGRLQDLDSLEAALEATAGCMADLRRGVDSVAAPASRRAL